MQRREFITLLGGTVAAWPLAAHAQQTERMRRVGILMPYSPTDKEIQERVQAFKEELRKLGWTAGINVQFDERWTTDNMDLIGAAAANLLELKPDVVLAIGGRVIPILMKLTSSIPIIVPGGAGPLKEVGSKVSLGLAVTSRDFPRLSSRSSARCCRRSKRLRQIFRMLR
jgi:putative ABC transport system substrate-binding protein